MAGITDENLLQYLTAKSQAEIIDWIMQQTSEHDGLRRALISFVAPQADTELLVSELKQLITKAWARTRSRREPWKLAKPIAADLEPVLAALEQMIDRGQAEVAEKVLKRFVAASEKGMASIDDSGGYLWPVCQEGVKLWGKAWANIPLRDPSALAKLVYDGVRDNGYAIRDHMIGDFAEALGKEGLLTLKELFIAEHQVNLSRKGIGALDRREPLRYLADVADALGDVDLYIDTQRQCGLEKIYALPIARRQLEAGRPAEALASLDLADPSHSHFHDEKDDYTTLRKKILLALGREDEAHKLMWREFNQTLSKSSLDQLLAMTAKDQQPALATKAIAVAEKHSDKLIAAMFLQKQGHADRAAAIISSHPEAFDGRHFGFLLPLAEALAKVYPASAWVLYRSLLLNILEEKRYNAYPHAADYLVTADVLATTAGLQDKQQILLAKLRSEHGLKSSFWKRVQELNPSIAGPK